MTNDTLARVQTALTQEARKFPERTTAMTVSDVMTFLARIIDQDRHALYSRARLVHLGKYLMRHGLCVLAPACPDYAHHEGVYTFRDVSGGTSLLAQLQIEFLQQLGLQNVTLMYADVERFDSAIRATLRIDEADFFKLIQQSCADSKCRVPSTWNVVLMSDFVPKLYERSEARMQLMLADEHKRQRLVRETHERSRMYAKIVPRASFDELLERTTRTAAQYCELGEFALRHGFVISNHVTTNLAWYDEVRAPVLLNPVRIY